MLLAESSSRRVFFFLIILYAGSSMPFLNKRLEQVTPTKSVLYIFSEVATETGSYRLINEMKSLNNSTVKALPRFNHSRIPFDSLLSGSLSYGRKSGTA